MHVSSSLFYGKKRRKRVRKKKRGKRRKRTATTEEAMRDCIGLFSLMATAAELYACLDTPMCSV
jgi:hypothetical protein